MDQMVWWVLVVQLGVAGSMATIGSLNVQWWSQDRSERVLGLTGVLCWSVAFALILGAVGLAFPELTVWQVIVPVRAVLIGAIVALLLATLSAVVPLPGARAAFVTSVAVPVVFVGVGLTGDRAYVFVGGSPWPVFQPLGKVLVGLSLLIFIAYSVVAVRLLHGVRRWQLAAATGCAVVLVEVAVIGSPGLLPEAMTGIWPTPIAILLAWWCSARVLTLQGSWLSAVAGRKLAEHAVDYQARHDPLTGLPNQTAGVEALQAMIHTAGSADRVMVAVVQVNGLGQVRAISGAKAADAMLQVVAVHLASVLPPAAEMARIGESTFLIMTRRRRSRPVDELEAEVAHLVSDMPGSALPPELSVVVGIAMASESSTAADLLQQSRIAVTAANQAGRPMQLYRPELRDGIVREARTVRLLGAAVARDEFELHYQPVLDAVTGTRVAVEVLTRWRHHGRLHPPAEWIPIAEQNALMPAIGLQVLRIAVRDYPTLRCPIAVNVSARQLADPDFAPVVLSTLDDCPPAALILEVTESSVIADPVGATATLQSLRRHGIRIALDDFGTQYSSLSRLATLPFDIVKIDRSFVSRVLTTDGRAMVTAIQALARALGKTTVAEGVETIEQLKALQDIECDHIQGFLTGRPVSLSEMLDQQAVETGTNHQLFATPGRRGPISATEPSKAVTRTITIAP